MSSNALNVNDDVPNAGADAPAAAAAAEAVAAMPTVAPPAAQPSSTVPFHGIELILPSTTTQPIYSFDGAHVTINNGGTINHQYVQGSITNNYHSHVANNDERLDQILAIVREVRDHQSQSQMEARDLQTIDQTTQQTSAAAA